MTFFNLFFIYNHLLKYRSDEIRIPLDITTTLSVSPLLKFYNTLNVAYSEFYNYQDDSYFVQAII